MTHWTNYDWVYERVTQTSFYCNCCEIHVWYKGACWVGKDYWGKDCILLCDLCKQNINTNCDHGYGTPPLDDEGDFAKKKYLF